MARLLDNSEKTITHIYVIAGENTRALVRLAAVNRRMRAVWLQDSDYIIARSLELQAPDHQDAIGLAQCQSRAFVVLLLERMSLRCACISKGIRAMLALLL
jgi:hypothetical protein